jgi:hypothetical protein
MSFPLLSMLSGWCRNQRRKCYARERRFSIARRECRLAGVRSQNDLRQDHEPNEIIMAPRSGAGFRSEVRLAGIEPATLRSGGARSIP